MFCSALSDSRIWGVNLYQHHEYHFMCFCNSPCEYMCTYEHASCIFYKTTYNKLVLYDIWNKTRYQICSTTRLLSLKHLVISTANGTFSIKKNQNTVLRTPHLGLLRSVVGLTSCSNSLLWWQSTVKHWKTEIPVELLFSVRAET